MSAQVIVMAIPMSPGKPPNRWWHCCAGASWSSTTARWMSCSTSSACRVASVRMIRWDDPMVSWCWIWRTIWRTYFEICFYMIYMVETSWILVLKQVFFGIWVHHVAYIYIEIHGIIPALGMYTISFLLVQPPLMLGECPHVPLLSRPFPNCILL